MNKDLVVTIPIHYSTTKYYTLSGEEVGLELIEGTYLLSYDLVNGKKHWIQEKGEHAIWYCDDPSVFSCGTCWMIGPKSHLGSNEGYFTPASDFQCENECSLEEITQWTQWTPGGQKQYFDIILKGKGLYKAIVFCIYDF